MSTDLEGDGDFVELLFKEVQAEGVDCPSAQMLVEMAKSSDYDTVADALGYITEMGCPDKAAELLRRIMQQVKAAGGAAGGPAGGGGAGAAAAAQPGGRGPAGGGGPGKSELDYTVAAKVLNRTVELGHLTVAQDLVKFLLVSRETDRGRGKMLDCYDASFVLGAMVPEGAADSAGRLLFALYSAEGGEDSAASQTLVPFILGTLLDHNKVEWAVELGKQLMYTTLEEIESGAGEYDYSVLGWCLAQMVWYGRADWAAKLCVELERQELGWYDAGELLGSVAGWGDRSYSITIENFMREARRGGNGPPPPQQGR